MFTKIENVETNKFLSSLAVTCGIYFIFYGYSAVIACSLRQQFKVKDDEKENKVAFV